MEYFDCLKNPLCFAYSSISTSTTTDLYIVSIDLLFSECQVVEIT